jgi:hypothetical protein
MTHSFGNSNSQDGVTGYTAGPNTSGVVGQYEDARSLGHDRHPISPPLSPPSGVMGIHHGLTSDGGAGVHGESDTGVGVQGKGHEAGIRGRAKNGVGVEGITDASDQNGIFGMNAGSGTAREGLNRPAGSGVWGHTTVEKGAGVVGSVQPGLTEAAGIAGIGTIAGKFIGDVVVTGDVRVTGDVQLTGGDVAEHFDIANNLAVEPGTVMVFNVDGALRACDLPYDTRVVGVISGAGHHKPGVVLDSEKHSDHDRQPIALVGKVYCKVDAQFCPIHVGDLLTTSLTPGHAMKATDPNKAFGAVLGKAMGSLAAGTSLLPVLVLLR